MTRAQAREGGSRARETGHAGGHRGMARSHAQTAKEIDTLEPSSRRATRRMKGPEVISHEKLGMLSLQKIERKVTGISSNIFKLLHD